MINALLERNENQMGLPPHPLALAPQRYLYIQDMSYILSCIPCIDRQHTLNGLYSALFSK